MPELDPKPWFCSNCSDRFVHYYMGQGHSTIFKPRARYSQAREDYRD